MVEFTKFKTSKTILSFFRSNRIFRLMRKKVEEMEVIIITTNQVALYNIERQSADRAAERALTKRGQDLQNQQYYAGLSETSRHNVAVENETSRHNVAQEQLMGRQIDETVRHNIASESTERTKAQAASDQAKAALSRADTEVQRLGILQQQADTQTAGTIGDLVGSIAGNRTRGVTAGAATIGAAATAGKLSGHTSAAARAAGSMTNTTKSVSPFLVLDQVLESAIIKPKDKRNLAIN